MNLFLLVAVGVILLGIFLLVMKAQASSDAKPPPPDLFYLKKSLFTPAERSFAGVLDVLALEKVFVASKVRLADIFGIRKGLERGGRQSAQNRINGKHVDFLLIQKSDGRPLLGIELDDRSHEADDRIARDAFVDSVFSSAGLPLLHITAKAAYDPREVRRQIDEALATPARPLAAGGVRGGSAFNSPG